MSVAICLTPRETDVLRATADGMSQKEAAKTLGLAPRTVEMFSTKARAKLGARNSAHMVALAFRFGLLDAEQLA